MSHLNKHDDFFLSAFKKARNKEGEKTIFKTIDDLYKNFVKNENEEKYILRINKTQKLFCKNFLFQKILDENLVLINKSIMIAGAEENKKIIVPIPISWFYFLKSKKAKINSLFLLFFLKNLILNILRGIKEIFKLKKYKTKKKINEDSYLTILSFPTESLINQFEFHIY